MRKGQQLSTQMVRRVPANVAKVQGFGLPTRKQHTWSICWNVVLCKSLPFHSLPRSLHLRVPPGHTWGPGFHLPAPPVLFPNTSHATGTPCSPPLPSGSWANLPSPPPPPSHTENNSLTVLHAGKTTCEGGWRSPRHPSERNHGLT